MMTLVPINFDEAQIFIDRHHRHHGRPVGHKFSIAASVDDSIVGVVTVGRPVARHMDDGYTLEVNRLCTNGYKNACSFLYSAAWRVARNMGYRRLITYILNTEPGTSLKAAGWKCLYETKSQSWNTKSRPRVDKHPTQAKLLWEIK